MGVVAPREKNLALIHYSTHAFLLVILAVPALANAGHDCDSFVRSVNVFV